MTEEEKKKMKDLEDALAVANAKVKEATDKGVEKDTTIAKLGDDLKKKDEVIDQKNKDIIGSRKTYKALKDMTDEEKNALSAAELELKDRQEKFEADQKKFQEDQAADKAKQTASLRSQVFKKFVGAAKPEVAKKFGEFFDQLKDSDKASTLEEIEAKANLAFNMLGDDKPTNPVRDIQNGTGGGDAPNDTGGDGKKVDFAETPEGQGLAGMLGLASAPKAGDQANPTK